MRLIAASISSPRLAIAQLSSMASVEAVGDLGETILERSVAGCPQRVVERCCATVGRVCTKRRHGSLRANGSIVDVV